MKKEEEEEDASLESGYHRELPDDVEDEEEEEEEKEDVDQEPEVEFEVTIQGRLKCKQSILSIMNTYYLSVSFACMSIKASDNQAYSMNFL